MVKLLEGIEELGEEVRCKNCQSIIHVEADDWKRCSYYLAYDREIRHNDYVDCPKCWCSVHRFEDN